LCVIYIMIFPTIHTHTIRESINNLDELSICFLHVGFCVDLLQIEAKRRFANLLFACICRRCFSFLKMIKNGFCVDLLQIEAKRRFANLKNEKHPSEARSQKREMSICVLHVGFCFAMRCIFPTLHFFESQINLCVYRCDCRHLHARDYVCVYVHVCVYGYT